MEDGIANLRRELEKLKKNQATLNSSGRTNNLLNLSQRQEIKLEAFEAEIESAEREEQELADSLNSTESEIKSLQEGIESTSLPSSQASKEASQHNLEEGRW